MGTDTSEEKLADLKPAPPPGDSRRKRWRGTTAARGPIGLLLCALHAVGGAMCTDIKFHQFQESPIDIYNVPWQHLGPLVEERAVHARIKQASGDRTLLQGMGELDRDTLTHALKKCDNESPLGLEIY